MADWDHTGTGSVAHNNAVIAAHATRQAAYKSAGSSPALVRAADLAFHRAVLASAKAQGLTAAATVSMEAIWELTGFYN
jgi:hypothetical protein